MRVSITMTAAAVALLGVSNAQPVAATPSSLLFSTGSPDGKIATATRPDVGSFEIESADDFNLTGPTALTSATFTGLVPAGSSPTDVVVEIYQVFPLGSNVNRTSGPIAFATSNVPTRVNSPSDVAFASRDSSTPGELTFTTNLLAPSFTASNSVTPGGIHAQPGQTTNGNGAATGQEVEFDVTFTDPLTLPADHYFFVPQVALDNGNFLWLSAPKPITGGTGPFLPDLQSWTRDAKLDPDWLRVGTDIVGTGAFNATFSLTGVVPEPGTMAVLGSGLLGLVLLRRPKSQR